MPDPLLLFDKQVKLGRQQLDAHVLKPQLDAATICQLDLPLFLLANCLLLLKLGAKLLALLFVLALDVLQFNFMGMVSCILFLFRSVKLLLQPYDLKFVFLALLISPLLPVFFLSVHRLVDLDGLFSLLEPLNSRQVSAVVISTVFIN